MERHLICGLCGNVNSYLKDGEGNSFRKCAHCALIQKDPLFFPDHSSEYRHYLTHNNDPEDARYLQFLSQAIDPVLPLLKNGMQALDYGCGPGPAIGHILKQHQISCDNYDPIFQKDGIQRQLYDVIFCTECFEHFHHPIRDIKRILSLLKTGGYLSVMTTFYQEENQFPNWYYARDPTHVSFFHTKTMIWIQKQLNLGCIFTDDKKVIVLKKK
ncbi:MAG: class I SAM-dependent methyltransferase [Cyclobacteriaceae bacterium]